MTLAAIRRLVPRAIRRGVGAQVAEIRARRIEQGLSTLAAGGETIVAGPWLGEVGFEALYWVPFLAWFAERFDVDPGRLVVVSRGGTASWYQPFAAGYRDIFDHLPPEEFRRRHDERVAINGEQKQTQVLAFEHRLLQEIAGDVAHRRMLHPSTMYRLFAPFWWTHVDEGWVHRRTRYRRLQAPPVPPGVAPPGPYTAVKFYFNECFPATEANRACVRETLAALVAQGPVVSLTTGLALDDHGSVDVRDLGALALPDGLGARDNLAVQAAVVAGATRFVGTYGGFSYLAPFSGVAAVAYYSDAAGFSPRHLVMAHSAFGRIGAEGLLDVRPVGPVRPQSLVMPA